MDAWRRWKEVVLAAGEGGGVVDNDDDDDEVGRVGEGGVGGFSWSLD